MYGHKARSGPSVITVNSRALMAKYFLLVMGCALGSPLGDSIKVSVWCPGGLGKHGCDSEVLIHREGTLCQTLSARDPPG